MRSLRKVAASAMVVTAAGALWPATPAGATRSVVNKTEVLTFETLEGDPRSCRLTVRGSHGTSPDPVGAWASNFSSRPDGGSGGPECEGYHIITVTYNDVYGHPHELEAVSQSTDNLSLSLPEDVTHVVFRHQVTFGNCVDSEDNRCGITLVTAPK